MRVMNHREVAIVLHALRTLQDGPSKERDACEHFASCTPMDNIEIDALCESINFNGVCFGKGSPDDNQKLAALRAYLENTEFGADSLDAIWQIIGEGDSPAKGTVSSSQPRKSSARKS
jgi:hypothetical protein